MNLKDTYLKDTDLKGTYFFYIISETLTNQFLKEYKGATPCQA